MKKERNKIGDIVTIQGEEYIITKQECSNHPCPGCQLGQLCGRTKDFSCSEQMPSNCHLKKWNNFETQWNYYATNWLQKKFRHDTTTVLYTGPLHDINFINNLLAGIYDNIIDNDAKNWFLSKAYSEELQNKFPTSSKQNMKEIRIEVPVGMEVDEENSTFECIRFKPKKQITYEDVQTRFRKLHNTKVYDDDLACSKQHHKKLEIFRKLIEVSDYLNNGWKPNWTEFSEDDKYFIVYDDISNGFTYGITQSYKFHPAYFKSKEDVLEAIRIIGNDDLKMLIS